MAGAAQFIFIVQEHRAAIASMRIVTAVAAIFKCRMSAGPLGSFSDPRVAGKTELTSTGFQQTWTIGEMGVMALDAAALPEGCVDHRTVSGVGEIAVACLTQSPALLQQANPSSAWLSVARFARTLLEGHVLRDASQHMSVVRTMRLMARPAIGTTHRNGVLQVGVVRVVAQPADLTGLRHQQGVEICAVRVVTSRTVINHRRVRNLDFSACGLREAIVARQAQLGSGFDQLDTHLASATFERVTGQTVVDRRCVQNPYGEDLIMTGLAGGLFGVHQGRVVRRRAHSSEGSADQHERQTKKEGGSVL